MICKQSCWRTEVEVSCEAAVRLCLSVCLFAQLFSVEQQGGVKDRSDAFWMLIIRWGGNVCECNWTPWPSGQLRFCLFVFSHVGFRFLLLRSAVSLTARSFCTGGVMKQGKAPDMIEGKTVIMRLVWLDWPPPGLIIATLCLLSDFKAVYCSNITNTRMLMPWWRLWKYPHTEKLC